MKSQKQTITKNKRCCGSSIIKLGSSTSLTLGRGGPHHEFITRSAREWGH